MTIARRETVIEGVSRVYHCISRCVRRAFLCGTDEYTGMSYEHRKDWIKSRLEHLAACFAIEVCAYAVMSNHLHVVLRTRPDWVDSWTNEEIARQWLKVFPGKDDEGRPLPPDEREVRSLAYSRKRMKELRSRLSSISWFMRCLNENIARRANREDHCKGRFWEGRFKCQALLDDSAVLACMAYVDLNPIRAGIAETPEESLYTSVHDRIMARKKRENQSGSPSPTETPPTKTQQKKKTPPPDAWLCPIGKSSTNGRRGILDMTLEEYIELVDWTGRKILENKRGAIPLHLGPVLLRLNVEEKHWLSTVRNFGSMFHRAAGRMESMIAAARQSGQRWLRGFRIAGQVFFST